MLYLATSKGGVEYVVDVASVFRNMSAIKDLISNVFVHRIACNACIPTIDGSTIVYRVSNNEMMYSSGVEGIWNAKTASELTCSRPAEHTSLSSESDSSLHTQLHVF